ncbi:MAG: hypothetical protein AB7O86_05745 [Porticoccaceae bacterium]
MRFALVDWVDVVDARGRPGRRPDVPNNEDFSAIDLGNRALLILPKRVGALTTKASRLDIGDRLDNVPGPVIRTAVGNRLGITIPAGSTWKQIFGLLVIERQAIRASKEGRHQVWLGPELLYDAPAISGGATYTDPFTRSDSTTLGSPWVEESGNLQIKTNSLRETATSTGAVAYYNTAVGSNDMFVQADMVLANVASSSHPYLQLFTRYAVGGGGTNYTGYAAGEDPWGVRWVMNRWNSGSFTELGSYSATVTDGTHVVYLESNGSSHTFKLGGTTRIGPITDSNITTGQLGAVEIYVEGNVDDGYIDNFSVGSLGGASPINVNAQVAALALTGVAGSLGLAALNVNAQVAALALTGVAGTPTLATLNVSAQVAALALTGVAGSLGLAALNVNAQVAALALTGVAGTPFTAGGAINVNAQVAALTLTGVAGSLGLAALNVNAQVAALALTGVAGTPSAGAASAIDVIAQVALLSLTGVAGTPHVPFIGTPIYSATPKAARVTAAPTVVTTVTDAVQELLFGPSAIVTRRCDIYENDGVTIWMADAPILDGSVGVDMNRDERRSFELTLHNEDGDFASDPDGFWYDKVIKLYRGVRSSTISYEALLGTFAIDRIASPRFPSETKVTGRDYSKKLIVDKFGEATTFTAATPVENAIKGILASGGITSYEVPTTGQTLGKSFAYEAGTSRWQALKEIATAFGYEIFFSIAGTFIMRTLTDPTTAPLAFTFTTEGALATLTDYEKATHDARLFNSCTVLGQTTTNVPVAYTAENTEPSSPTRIARIGRRSMPPYTSALVANETQAETLARAFLSVMALESYEIKMDSLVVPWLEAATTVEFEDPDPVSGAPSRFLLSDFNIPLMLDTMSANSKRVTIVG